MFVLNKLNIDDLENYLNTIFDLEMPIKDKNIAVLEFELKLDALADKFIETGTLQYVGQTPRA